VERVGFEVDDGHQVDGWAVLWPSAEAVDAPDGELEVEWTALGGGGDRNGLDGGFVGGDGWEVAGDRAIAGEIDFQAEAFGSFRRGGKTIDPGGGQPFQLSVGSVVRGRSRADFDTAKACGGDAFEFGDGVGVWGKVSRPPPADDRAVVLVFVRPLSIVRRERGGEK